MSDRRDMRDPCVLGDTLLELRKTAPKREKPGQTYDKHHAVLLAVPPYDDKGGIAAETAAQYAEEFPDGIPATHDIDPAGE